MGYSTRQSWLGNEYRRRFNYSGHQSFHGGGYSNFGFWDESTRIGEQGDNLVQRLLDFLPSTQGKILDVACGQGGTTRRLSASFPPASITAINLFDDQLRHARERAPGCTFLQMDAAQLAFADECFDAILCVEAAFHFETREHFLRQSFRVLKPGGYLLLSDLLVAGPSVEIPQANVVSRAEYEEVFKRAGFPRPAIVSARDRTWEQHRRRYLSHTLRTRHWLGAISWWLTSQRWDKGIVDYLLVSAQKPGEVDSVTKLLSSVNK